MSILPPTFTNYANVYVRARRANGDKYEDLFISKATVKVAVHYGRRREYFNPTEATSRY